MGGFKSVYQPKILLTSAVFSLNPDGYILKTRNNAQDRDLNRSFPDWAELGTGHEERLQGRQPETRAVMEWLR